MKTKLLCLLICISLLSACTALPEASSAEEFSFREVAEVFALTDEDIFALYGAPDGEEQVSYYGMPAHEFRYGDDRFRTEASSGYLYYALLTGDDPAFAPPRDTGIGMTFRALIAAYAASGDETLYTAPDGAQYRLLYGDYETGYTYGAVFYEGNAVRLVEYAEEGCGIAYGIENGKVCYVEYFVK